MPYKKAQEYVDFQKLQEILEKNQGKEIICFGGGTAGKVAVETVLREQKITCFLDNNRSLWGTEILGKKVENPDVLSKKPKGSFIIFIVSRHVVNISKQLEEYGLDKDKDFYNIYSLYMKYFRIKSFCEDPLERFLPFVDRFPVQNKENDKGGAHIGIVCVVSMREYHMWYPLAQYLLLRYCGYHVTLICDGYNHFDDFLYFSDYSAIARDYLTYALAYMEKRLGPLDIHWADECGRSELAEEDESQIKHFAKQNLIWHNANINEVVKMPDEKRIENYIGFLRDNQSYIKAFFEKNHFDTINVYTGIHKHRCLYTYEGKKRGMRVSSYEANDIGVSYATDYPAGWTLDIRRLIKENMFTEDEKNELAGIAKKDFEKRIYSVVADSNGSRQQIDGVSETSQYEDAIEHVYQKTAKVPENQKFYDVIIPLNIAWDAAVLGLEELFASYKEWLSETVAFIMEKTDASVFVREHPGQAMFKDYAYEDVGKLLEKYAGNERFYICRSYEEINTYRMIEKCTVVLPYTSTVGIESALLGKCVIMNTKCHYADMEFVKKGRSKQEYFELIKNALCKKEEITENAKKDAYLVYLAVKKMLLVTSFTKALNGWMDESPDKLVSCSDVQKIIKALAENVPVVYKNMIEMLEER